MKHHSKHQFLLMVFRKLPLKPLVIKLHHKLQPLATEHLKHLLRLQLQAMQLLQLHPEIQPLATEHLKHLLRLQL